MTRTVKRILCLANSRKLSGRCIAGKEIVAEKIQGWIRPVSSRASEEVSEYERQYENGSDPRVLDIIDIPLIKPRPKGFQQENWLLDEAMYWTRVGQLTTTDLAKYEDPKSALWANGNSTYHGLNDQIALADTTNIRSSLRLIRVPKAVLKVFRPGSDFGDLRRRVQGRFKYAGDDYWLRVTDPEIERTYLAKGDGEHVIGASYLAISLGEPFNDHTYKLIAAVIKI